MIIYLNLCLGVRRGAINAKQLQYLSEYKSNKRLVSNNNKRFHCILT